MDVESILVSSGQYMTLIIFCLVFAFILAWFERKMIARMQNRVGPPLLQPVWDFLKLSAKEDIYVNKEGRFVLKYTPIVQLLIVLMLVFLLPIFGPTGVLSFEGDIFFYFTLFALTSATIYIIANSSKSPYTLIGGNRSIITEISLEIPLILAFAGIAIYAQSLNISTISSTFLSKITQVSSIKDIAYIIIFIVLFIVIVISYLGVLELNPFSTPKAETEIVGGWTTELTGKNLAIIELAEHIKVFVIAAFISTIFLGNSFGGYVFNSDTASYLQFLVNLLVFIIKVFVVTFILMFIHVVSSRSRINTIAKSFWFLLLISLLCIIGIVTLEVL